MSSPGSPHLTPPAAMPRLYYLLILLLIAAADRAGGVDSAGLITRDDFVNYDTTIGYPSAAVWPTVAIDAVGNVCQLHVSNDSSESTAGRGLVLSRLAADGASELTTTRLLPDTLAADSVWRPIGYTSLYVDASGRILVPVLTSLTNAADSSLGLAVKLYFFGPDGSAASDPKTAVFVPRLGNHLRPVSASGAVNDVGLCGVTWHARQAHPPHRNQVMVRLYDTRVDSFSPFLAPTKLDHPLQNLPDYRQHYQIKGPPVLHVGNEGGFVVAWVARHGSTAHVYYVVYNAAFAPATRVLMADCSDQADFTSSTECATSNVHTLAITGEADGDFYLVWSDIQLDLPYHHMRTHIWMRGFHADGSPKYTALRVDDADSTNVVREQLVYPQAACDDSGDVIVCWSDARLHSDSHRGHLKADVFVQRIDPQGSLLGPNMRVNNLPGIAGLKGIHYGCGLNNAGQVAVVWRDFGQRYCIKAQLMPLDMVGGFVPGDLNYDLRADSLDLRCLLGHAFYAVRNDSFWPRELADANGDGRLGDILDVLLLRRYLLEDRMNLFVPSGGMRTPRGKVR